MRPPLCSLTLAIWQTEQKVCWFLSKNLPHQRERPKNKSVKLFPEPNETIICLSTPNLPRQTNKFQLNKWWRLNSECLRRILGLWLTIRSNANLSDEQFIREELFSQLNNLHRYWCRSSIENSMRSFLTKFGIAAVLIVSSSCRRNTDERIANLRLEKGRLQLWRQKVKIRSFHF